MVENTREFIKYSQNIDVKEVFGLKIKDGKVVNRDGERIYYNFMNKNAKIRVKIEQMLKFLENGDEKEILVMAKGEGIQKMISVVEILKQKIKQVGEVGSGFKNDCVARSGDGEGVVVEFAYQQLNFVDYVMEEKEDEILQSGVTKVPVMYVYMRLSRGRGSWSAESVQRVKELVKSGWSVQES